MFTTCVFRCSTTTTAPWGLSENPELRLWDLKKSISCWPYRCPALFPYQLHFCWLPRRSSQGLPSPRGHREHAKANRPAHSHSLCFRWPPRPLPLRFKSNLSPARACPGNGDNLGWEGMSCTVHLLRHPVVTHARRRMAMHRLALGQQSGAECCP